MASTAAAPERNVVSRACNVEDIFNDFEARRAGLLKALTHDVDEFYEQCHPYHLNMRLYGLPNRSWELKVPEEDDWELLEIPAPTIGINFARPDSMHERMWLHLIAIHSDSWLLAVAFYYAAKSGFDLSDRERLHNMINDVPTLSEIVRSEAPVNNQASFEVTTEDEEDGSEDEAVREEDEVDQKDSKQEYHICEACNKNYKISDHWL
ncbi:putative Phd/F-box containing protein [Heracleum sosnowskyi]|uniref:PHD finger protein ALFIN-LIKE n=1 Tax=Heracleum sosnowskyi TaxID=360622 RepID=A0AAD8M5E4_9APIA|nr:putative Phd/F-box containing protein [Heracleum sosnowskyi]